MHMDMLVTKKIIIDYSHTLIRIAVVRDGRPTHFYIESPFFQSAQDRIVVGQVDKVVKNLQGAFIDFGEEKNGLLHLKQVPPYYQKRVQQGARLPVQIKKENTGDKGHKLTGYLNLQGHHLVCMVFEPEICISKQIKDNSKRQSIKDAIEQVSEGVCGFLVRTKAKDVPLHILQKEAMYLQKEARKILEMKDFVSKGTTLKNQESIALQVILDHFKNEVIEIVCNDAVYFKDIQEKLSYFIEEDAPIHYKVIAKEESLFKLYECEKYFDTALKHKVWLKNGGNIVIDYTEAMTVVDVNSAKAVLSKNQSKSVLELNQLAIQETFFQIMYRNLAGMIVIDLVEMKDPEHKETLYTYAKMLIDKYDEKSMKVYPLTELGLLQIVRTKKYSTLPEIMMGNCKVCKQSKAIKNTLQVLYELEMQIKQIGQHTIQQKVYVYCHPILKQIINKNELHKLFEKSYGIEVILQEDKKFDENKYEIKYHTM